MLDCHLVAGDFDYFLKIRVHDMADFNRLHGKALIRLPWVRQTRTFFVMKEVVDNARWTSEQGRYSRNLPRTPVMYARPAPES